MKNILFKFLAIGGICAATAFFPGQVKAEEYVIDGTVTETVTEKVLTVEVSKLEAYEKADTDSRKVSVLSSGEQYQLAGAPVSGWACIDLDGREAYVCLRDGATVYELAKEQKNEELLERQEIIRYALQFVGNRYVYGGSDPNTGADCSGFTRYVMKNTVGISLTHSSSAQSGEGTVISEDDIQPGDLVFYSNGSRINHVAIYMGNGQVVHASTEKTGIRVSAWDHRDPVKIVSIL